MFMLTLAVWIYMFYVRITAIRASGVEPRTRADLDKLPPQAVNSSNNLQNLFELPVIFYACVLALYVTHQVDFVYIICACGFFFFRIVHSAIHCTYNRVMHRFAAYAISSLFLWVAVGRFAIGTLSHGTGE
jgi:hypothetical protein